MQDLRQTSRYAKYLAKTGWEVENLDGNFYFIKKLPLLGAIIKIQRPENVDLKKIQKLAKKYRAFQVIVEPRNQFDAKFLRSVGFQQARHPFLPTKTLHLDLTKTQAELINQLKKDARAAIGNHSRLATCKFQLKDLEKFRKAWKKAVGIKHYVPSLLRLKALKKSFGNKALFLATKDTSSGAIFLLGDKIGYYWQAFTSQKGRKSLAQYRIVWRGILWAKTRGAKIFDFEGIYDERFPNKNWLGFTHFKKSFGGVEVVYPGTFVKRRLPR